MLLQRQQRLTHRVRRGKKALSQDIERHMVEKARKVPEGCCSKLPSIGSDPREPEPQQGSSRKLPANHSPIPASRKTTLPRANVTARLLAPQPVKHGCLGYAAETNGLRNEGHVVYEGLVWP